MPAPLHVILSNVYRVASLDRITIPHCSLCSIVGLNSLGHAKSFKIIFSGSYLAAKEGRPNGGRPKSDQNRQKVTKRLPKADRKRQKVTYPPGRGKGKSVGCVFFWGGGGLSGLFARRHGEGRRGGRMVCGEGGAKQKSFRNPCP